MTVIQMLRNAMGVCGSAQISVTKVHLDELRLFILELRSVRSLCMSRSLEILPANVS